MAKSTNSNDYVLPTYIRVQENADREIYMHLRRTSASVEDTIKSIVGDNFSGELRADQLLLLRRESELLMADMMRRAGFSIEAGKHEAAAAAIEAGFFLEKAIANTAHIPEDTWEQYALGAKSMAQQSLEASIQRIMGASYVPLAESVYRTTELVNGVVDRYIDRAIAQGLNAREIAKGIRDLIRPDVPGGVSYAAMRLARTEINNAFHATQVQKARDSEWVSGVEWNLSESHPDSGCLCPSYASDVHYEGGSPGVFPKDRVPRKPHPQCLCFMTSEIPDPDDFIDSLLEEYGDGDGGEAATYDEDMARVIAAEADDEFLEMYEEYSDAQWDDESLEGAHDRFNNRYFGSDNSYRINQYLRTGQPESMKPLVDDMLENEWTWGIPRDTVVYRGVGGVDIPANIVGSSWQDKAFQSTTTDLNHMNTLLSDGGFDSEVRFRILVPKGTNVLMYEDESEILLNAGSNLLIIGDEMKDGARWLTAILTQ